MTQIGESAARAAEEDPEEKQEDKKPLQIRISLFFDGTLNNRRNIEAREKSERAYNEHSNKTDDSYENGRTNIALMEGHAEESIEGYGLVLKVYTEGPGTMNLASDEMSGFAFGAGDSGVKAKVDRGIAMTVLRIQNEEGIAPQDYLVEKVTFDVFGFSRGAAGARYCIHELLKGAQPFYKRLESLGFSISEANVEVKFAGLYDTVASYKGGQMLHTDNWFLKLKSVSLVTGKVLHLVAADEHRKNFPLHNINSAGGKGEEYHLPGVHSDVGGSYNTADAQDRLSSVSTEQMLINRDDHQSVARDRGELINLGWYYDDEIQTVIRVYNEWGQPLQADLRVNKNNINSAYSNIPLKIMAEFARNEGLSIRSKLDRQASRLLRNFPELSSIEDRIKSYVSSVSHSKADDWLSYDSALKELRHNHLHFSAHFEGDLYKAMKPRFSRGKRKRYQFNG